MKRIIAFGISVALFTINAQANAAPKQSACLTNPSLPQTYRLGKVLGKKLAEGDSVKVANTIKEFVEHLSRDMNVSQQARFELYSGMSCTDPEDVHFSVNRQTVDFDLDLSTELIVNGSFGILDQFSRAPRFHHESGLSKAQGLMRANQYLLEHLAKQDAPTFIVDFNRRRVENGWLPDIMAVLRKGNAVLISE